MDHIVSEINNNKVNVDDSFETLKDKLNNDPVCKFVLSNISNDEKEKLEGALDFKFTFEKEYCIFKPGGIVEKIIEQLKSKNINGNLNIENFKDIEKMIPKLKEWKEEQKEEIRKAIDEQWKDFFKNNLDKIKNEHYEDYPYYYEQYRELSRLRWFFSDIENYTENDRLLFIDAFSGDRKMLESEKQNLYVNKTKTEGELKIMFKDWWKLYWVRRIPKNKIIVRRRHIGLGAISSLHKGIRRLRDSVFVIPTEADVYVEEFCNYRIAFTTLSDFFEAADVNHLLQFLAHLKETDETLSGGLEFIAIKPEEFEKLETLYKDMDMLATNLGDIYIKLEDSGKKYPRAKVRIIRHHNRDEETKDNTYYELSKKHGWLYLEDCENEEREIPISEILKRISPNGRKKLEDNIKEVEKKKSEGRRPQGGGEGKDKDKEAIESIEEILEKEGISRAASEILLRVITKEPEEVLHEIREIEKMHIREAHEEYLKYEEHGKEHGEILDIVFWVTLGVGTYMLIQEFIYGLGI